MTMDHVFWWGIWPVIVGAIVLAESYWRPHERK